MSNGSGSQGCTLVVASYSDVSLLIKTVIAEAGARLAMSPTLGDFFELRSVDVGPRPAGGARPGRGTVDRIADELTRPVEGVSEHYFALAVVDAGEEDAARLLRACRTEETIAGLPLRLRGLVADRSPEASASEADASFEIVLPSAGVWTQKTMVSELRGWAETLLNDFSGTGERGLAKADLTVLRKEAGFTLGSADDPVIPLSGFRNARTDPASEDPAPVKD